MRWLLLLPLLLAALASGQDLRHSFSPGDLSAAHLDDGEPLPCEACHERGAFVAEERCLECHEDLAAARARPDSFHATRTESCASCHAEHRGRDATLVSLDPSTFDHSQTGYPLTGAHVTTRCIGCHTGDGWLGADRACADCHDSPHGEGFLHPATLRDCADCHTTRAFVFAGAPFDHAATRYPLDGAHVDVACADCHAEARFAPVPSATCADCHDDPHRRADGACADCHATPSWDALPTPLPHARLGFALRGLHAVVACDDCHQGEPLAPLPHAACADCHDDPHDGAYDPRGCDACHDEHAPPWNLAGFEHPFPRTGAHATVACADCHVTEERPGTACADCHDDPHATPLPGGCADCHQATTWAETPPFDHALTGTPLEAGHADVACVDCHAESTLGAPKPDACGSCHEHPHDDAFAVDACLPCHAAEPPWRTVVFDHGTTDFALDGAHEGASCRTCHALKDFAAADATCASCHKKDAPRHHFVEGCDRCHGLDTWAGAELDVAAHALVGFPLDGVHARLRCGDCHPDGADASPVCFDCHGADDPHRNQLGDDCAACHRADDWNRSTFRHSMVGFPLRAEHALAECVDCHAAGYVGTPTDCDACHAGGASWP